VLLAAVLLPLLTVVLATARSHLNLADFVLVYLVAVVAITVVGGFWPAVLAAVAASLLLNWYFTAPIHTFTIAQPRELLALLLFVTVAVAVSSVVHLAARRALQAARAREEAASLLELAQTVLGGADSPAAVLEHLTRTHGGQAELQERVGGRWVRAAASGVDGMLAAASRIDIRSDLTLMVTGQDPSATPALLAGYAAQAAAALDRERLRTQAAQAEALAEGNRMRTALLAAVSHDLRTPLASIKASVSSLRQTDVEWSEADEADLLATIEQNADRLDALIGNLLDMSRLHTGSLQPFLRPTAIDEVAPVAAGGLDDSLRLEMAVPDGFPLVLADPGPARAGPGQLVLQRAAVLASRAAARAARCPGRGHGAARGGRPRAGRAGRAEGAHLRAVRAGRRPAPRRGARARGRARLRRGDGRADRRIRHAGRRPDGAGYAASGDRGPVGARRSAVFVVSRVFAVLAVSGVMTRVLVVDDEPSILRALRINLSAREYDVSTAVDGTTGLAAVARDRPDVIILDLGLPDMDGTEVIHGVRGWTSIPIIVLSAWGQESQKVAALDAGADDYVTKPFGMDELLARLRAAVRRAAPAPDEPVVATADFTVDLAAKQVVRSDGSAVRLTPTEWQVLEILVRNSGRLVTQKQLLREVWGPAYETESNYLRVYLAQLRRKLEPEPSRPRYLLTESGMGYRFAS
jgi:two-component system sensor histidine kinase KdpD